MEEPRRRYERLDGNRPGRNVCVSGRITDAQDDKIDSIAEEKDTTRSKILSDAVTLYLEETANTDSTSNLFNDPSVVTSSSTKEGNIDSTLLTILIEKGEDEGYIGIVPSLENCYSYGDTLDELFTKLQELIKANLTLL